MECKLLLLFFFFFSSWIRQSLTSEMFAHEQFKVLKPHYSSPHPPSLNLILFLFSFEHERGGRSPSSEGEGEAEKSAATWLAQKCSKMCVGGGNCWARLNSCCCCTNIQNSGFFFFFAPCQITVLFLFSTTTTSQVLEQKSCSCCCWSCFFFFFYVSHPRWRIRPPLLRHPQLPLQAGPPARTAINFSGKARMGEEASPVFFIIIIYCLIVVVFSSLLSCCLFKMLVSLFASGSELDFSSCLSLHRSSTSARRRWGRRRGWRTRTSRSSSSWTRSISTWSRRF